MLTFTAKGKATVDDADLNWLHDCLKDIRAHWLERKMKEGKLGQTIYLDIKFGFFCPYTEADAITRGLLDQQSDILQQRFRPMLHQDERLVLNPAAHEFVDLPNQESDMWVAMTYSRPVR